MPGDILEKAPSRIDFFDDAFDIRPEVARVVLAFSLSRLGKRLAWVSRKHGIDLAAPRARVEGFEVVPYGRCAHVSRALCGDEALPGVVFDFDVTGGGKARLGKLKTHVKSAAACTEGQAVSGR